MKDFADRKRTDRSFVAGDWVFLRVQPYIQTSLAHRANAKLTFRYFGPYQVLAPLGNQAYRLQLPEKAKIHPAFHVSQLRAGVPPSSTVHPELPYLTDDHPPLQVPEQVLDCHKSRRRRSDIDEVLVKWSGLPATLATSGGEHLSRGEIDHLIGTRLPTGLLLKPREGNTSGHEREHWTGKPTFGTGRYMPCESTPDSLFS